MRKSTTVVHVFAGGPHSGATKGTLLLHEGLLNIGVRSVLAGDNGSEYHLPAKSRITCLKERVVRSLRFRYNQWPLKKHKHRSGTLFTPARGFLDVKKLAERHRGSIVHLHWVGGGLINVRSLAELEVPCVWTLRDMWPFTGGCHYTLGCERFQATCSRCPQLASNDPRDLSTIGQELKRSNLPQNTTFVGISNWISELARSSSVLQGRDVRTVMNCIDTDVFFPEDESLCRQRLGIARDARVVLVGAVSPVSFYKGFAEFRDAMRLLPSDIQVVAFGSMKSESIEIPQRVERLGYVTDPEVLRCIYNAADVFVAPSRMEAFGKTVAESIACGTPAVAFDSSGPAEIVSDTSLGMLAESFDPRKLANAILGTLGKVERNEFDRQAMHSAMARFSPDVIARQYEQIYRSMLIRN